MSEVNIRIKIRFLNCAGFGLQSGNQLVRIPDNIYEVSLERSPTVFILDEKGEIVCSIINDKKLYETSDNVDRRKINFANHFNVLWNEDGRSYTVYRTPPDKEKRSNAKRYWIIGIIISIIIGVLVGCGIAYIIKHKSGTPQLSPQPIELPIHEPSPVLEPDTITQINVPEEPKVTEPTPEESKAVEAEKQQKAIREASIKAITAAYISELHSDNCTALTVAKVENWYNTLIDEEKGYTNIKNYIDAYKTFFEATKVDDITKLNKSKSLFSQNQRRVIFGNNVGKNGYGDPDTFNVWYGLFGMSFSEPYTKVLIR